jgi:hypothetical protein
LPPGHGRAVRRIDDQVKLEDANRGAVRSSVTAEDDMAFSHFSPRERGREPDLVRLAPDRAHHHWVAHVQMLPLETVTQTQPASFPASVVIVQTSLPVPVVHGVVQAVLSATPAAHAGGEALG